MAEDMTESLLQHSKIIAAETVLDCGLVLPGVRQFNPPKNSKKHRDGPLPIRQVDKGDIDIESLSINLCSLLIIFLVVKIIIKTVLWARGWTTSAVVTYGIPLSVAWVFSVLIYYRTWTTVAGRKAKIFLDTLSGKLIVYLAGFHFVVWYATAEIDDVNYQKMEVRKCLIENGKGIKFQSKDGYELAVDLTLMWSRRSDLEAMSYSLRYEVDELGDWILAVVVSRLSDLGGCNDYEDLLKNKEIVTAWVANIFGGEDHISPMEIETGTAVKNPIAGNLDLTDESKKLRAGKARADLLAKYTKHFIEVVKLTPEDAAIAAQLATDLATREIVTYQGIPDGATFVALGDKALAASGGKKVK